MCVLLIVHADLDCSLEEDCHERCARCTPTTEFSHIALSLFRCDGLDLESYRLGVLSTPTKCRLYGFLVLECECDDWDWAEHGACIEDLAVLHDVSDIHMQINLSSLNTFQQAVLFGLILLGHPILISSTVLFVRKRAFETKFQGIAEEHARRHFSLHHGLQIPLAKLRRKTRKVNEHVPRTDEVAASNSQPTAVQPVRSNTDGAVPIPGLATANANADVDAIQWLDDDQVTISPSVRERARHRVFQMAGVGAHPDIHHPRDVAPQIVVNEERRPSVITHTIKGSQKYLWSKGFVSRNSQFYGLTPTEREKLGGVEYQAVSFLSIIIPLYYALFNLLGVIGLGSWLAVNKPTVALDNGLGPFWTGAFFSVSAFGNNGMSLLDLNVTVLQTRYDSTFTMMRFRC
jgi:hypothetical protein